jgi:effector protein SidI
MPKIFLLTAPFDEEARTGDGQYAASLVEGFATHYSQIPCKWLKRESGDYAIPFPTGATSIPADTIPSAIVLQPVANEKTIVSGYRLNNAFASPVEAQKVNSLTVSPKTSKVIVNHDNSLHSLTIMDIYSKKIIVLDKTKVTQIMDALEEKKTKLLQAVENNAGIVAHKKLKVKLEKLTKAYHENQDIKGCCSLNEFLEAHVDKKKFLDRHAKAFTTFKTLSEQFTGATNLEKLKKLTDQLTGVKEYHYDFHSNNLTYDLERDASFRSNFYNFADLKKSVDNIINNLRTRAEVRIRSEVSERYAHSFNILSNYEGDRVEVRRVKLALIEMIYADGNFKKTYDKQIFIKALLDANLIDHDAEAIRSYKKISNILAKKEDILANKNGCRTKLVEKLQSIMAKNDEPYVTANKNLDGFYAKRKLSASEGFHLAYEASRRDPLKPQLIANIIQSMQPIDADTHLDVHIRPPDCGVFITPEDIKRFQHTGIRVNLTIHEYKQNYTRRYLQQYTHDLMRQANTVQFFNASDRDNAIIAASYGDCDKRNTLEPTGVAKKAREVGSDYPLEKFPVATYDLKRKSGLTVASQKLSTEPANPKDVVLRPANILSFGTIRAGKGFEEALELAQLVKINADGINSKLNKVPIVKLAGDPQDFELMQAIVVERFGKNAVEIYQHTNAYDEEFTSNQRRIYWKELVSVLNKKVTDEEADLSNPYLEIYPWCESHELLGLKKSCKYVCRLDDMGMRNNGSAIISVLDVGIIYTKFGSVTDDIFIKEKGGQYSNAVDLGQYRYGKYSLLKMQNDFIAKHGPGVKLPKWLIDDPNSSYKRKEKSRDPQEILDSIIAREVNQLQFQGAEVVNSENYKTVVEAHKLLTERFTLKNAADHLLENVGLNDNLVVAQVDADDVDPLAAQAENLNQLAVLQLPPVVLSVPSSKVAFFGSRAISNEGLIDDQESNKMDNFVTAAE